MARKPVQEGGKREQIIRAAKELFFTNGYDATSVRTIMKQAGGEVGLFYYYFKNKDDAFDQALDLFFDHYEVDFARIVAHGRRNPCRLMQEFFEYMERETQSFRQEYAPQMHRTVRWAIREHTLEIIEPYLREVIDIQSEYYHTPPAVAPDVAAVYLTYGVGSAILHEDAQRYLCQRAEVKRGISLLMGMDASRQELRIPYPATQADIPGWMALMRETKEYFPGLDETQHKAQLAGYLARGEAWVLRGEGQVLAAMLYSKERRALELLTVAPRARRMGLATKLVETAAAQFPVGEKLSVLTFCDNDPLGGAARAFYRALGFAPAEETTAFGARCQRFVLTVPDCPPQCVRAGKGGPDDG